MATPVTEPQRALLVAMTYGEVSAVHDTYDGRPRLYTATGEYRGTCHPNTMTALAQRGLLTGTRHARATMYKLSDAGRALGVSL